MLLSLAIEHDLPIVAVPDGQSPSSVVDDATAQQIVEFDLTTRTQSIRENPSTASAKAAGGDYTPGNSGADMAVSLLGPPAPAQPGPDEATGAPGYIFPPDGRSRVANSALTSFPWRTIGRLWVLWPNGSESACSAAMIGPRHLFTAGHCIYDASRGGWASQAYFSAGQDGLRINDPYWSNTDFKRSEYQYYGEARATYFRSYVGWTNSGDWNYDMAFVTLDRNIGNYTGWMGYGWNNDNNFFQNLLMNTAGYPGDLTPNELDMYHVADQITTVNTLNLQSNRIDIWPGQSGSPVWYFDGTNRYMYATVSSQWTDGSGNPIYNQFTRMNQQRYDNINQYKIDDGATTDYPDLVDYDEWFNSNFAFHTSSIQRGGQINITTYVRNVGTASAGSFYVNFYLSTNNIISTGDTLLGSASVASLSPFNWASTAWTGNVPSSVTPGTYYLGYIIDAGNSQSEFVEYNNTRLIPGTLSITAISPDRFEANNSLATATNFGTIGGTRFESGLSVHEPNNADYYRFTAGGDGTLSVNLSFSHAQGDVDVQLLSAAGTYLTGSGSTTDNESFSYPVTRATTYYVYVYGYAGALNPSYSLSITAPAVAPDRFEPNDSLAAPYDFGSLNSRTENALSIHASGNADYYLFTPSVTGRLDVSLAFLHLNGDIDVALRDTTGNFLGGSGGVVDGESFSANVLAAQPYVLHVYGFAGATNVDYSMSLNIVAVPTVLSHGFQYLNAPQRLTYQFSEDVSASLSTADLTLQNLTTSTTVPPGNIALSYDSGTNTATFSFPGFSGGILPDGNYRATLLAAGVTNSSGTPMAANFVTDFFTLAGDANRDRIVNIRDLSILTANWQQSPRDFSQADFNYDTVVNRLDLDVLAMNWQVALPIPASPPPVSGQSRSPEPLKRIAAPLFSAERIAEDELLTMLG